MTAHSMEPTYTELRQLTAISAGWNDVAPISWTTEQTRRGAFILEEALAQFYFAYEWSFLKILGTISLNNAYATGTIAIASGVVTGTGTTFPTGAANYDLWVNGNRYPVASRASGTSITLNDTSVTVSAGATYSLVQYDYDLPDDFGSIPSNAFTFQTRSGTTGPGFPVVGERVIRGVERYGNHTGVPQMATLLPVAAVTTQSTRWQARFWPVQACTVEYRYKALPPALDGSTYIYPYGGPVHANTIKASVVDMTYQKMRNSFEKHEAFMEQLQRSIDYDRRHNAVHTYGKGRRSLAARGSELDSMLRDVRSSIPAESVNLSFG